MNVSAKESMQQFSAYFFIAYIKNKKKTSTKKINF